MGRWLRALWDALWFRCPHEVTNMSTDGSGNLILRCWLCGKLIATSEERP